MAEEIDKLEENMDEGDSEGSSQNSNSPEPLTDEDEVDERKISELEEQVKNNPYLYDSHVQLINLRRKLGDLDEVRKAREEMSKIFPLTPDLWLDWLTDEQKLAATESEKKAIIDLCERAVKDYTSVSLWLEYVQFMIGQMGGDLGVETVRATFEKALSAVGIHVTEGSLIWDAFREFENALLSTVECTSENSEEQWEKKIQEQKNRVYNLYKRQLSVPLMYMDKTYKEFQEAFPGPVDSIIEKQYQRACEKLEKVKPYEDAIFKSEPPHLEEFKKYIQYEKEKGDPARVQNLYERALLENCLLPDLWLEYTKYLDEVIKVENVILPAYERAIRNCPWSVICWKNYAMALERHNQPHDVIKGVYEKALASGFTEGEEYREIWLGYLDYLRRRIKWNEDHETQLKDLNDVFERATEHIMTYYKQSDPQCSVLQYWAKIEAKYCKNMTRAREIWNDIMNHGHHGEAEMWLAFANFERLYGDEKHYRKLLLKGLHSASDWPESIGNLLLTFEREEGTLETLDIAVEKYENQMQRVQERRQKAAEKEAEKKQMEAEQKMRAKAEKKSLKLASVQGRQMPSAKSSSQNEVKMDAEGFKIPLVPPRSHTLSEKKQTQHATASTVSPSKPESSKRPAEEELQSESKKPKVEDGEKEETDHGVTVQHDPLKDSRTVFLSNLAYSTEEDEIKELFSEVGTVEEVRLVRDYKGRSKGYCYVVYSSQSEAQSALQKDRSKLGGRPVFVSPCQDKRHGGASQQKFKFSTGLEKNKLFVKGLPFTTTEDDLKEMFKQYGNLKEVRLVTYRNGHSKGLAYIEYENESDAAAALVKTDGTNVGEHTITVAISNPPERKLKKDVHGTSSSVTVSGLLGGGSSVTGARGKGRTQVSLLPRALQKPVAQKTSSTVRDGVQNGDSKDSLSNGAQKRLSNADFRSMLLKK